MAWIAVNKNGEEVCFNNKPTNVSLYGRHLTEWEDILYVGDGDEDCDWSDEVNICVNLPSGTIKKLIGKNLTWEDCPVEI